MEKPNRLLARLAVIAVSAGAVGLSVPAVASAATSTEISPQAQAKAREAVAAAEPSPQTPSWIQIVWCRGMANSPDTGPQRPCMGPFRELLS